MFEDLTHLSRLVDWQVLVVIYSRKRIAFPIFTGTLTTGEAARETPFEDLEGVFYLDDKGIVESPIRDDQSIFVNLKNRGI